MRISKGLGEVRFWCLSYCFVIGASGVSGLGLGAYWGNLNGSPEHLNRKGATLRPKYIYLDTWTLSTLNPK